MVDKEMLINALKMALEDYAADEDDITENELTDINRRFSALVESSLKPMASDEDEDEDEDDDVDDDSDDEDSDSDEDEDPVI